ncbi:unnamed protein product [Musa acuminata subsp. malaccensis]|uniref:Uncharacterized protein n=1 Tax=Musa acuminata subsp. malaccensis TaxID=214687 RepID=A0A804V5E5_MUSAM|nr:unnamed protein product [Musa acuminata subsp. malaccensis]
MKPNLPLRHYYLIFHSGIPTNNHKGPGEQPCRSFSSLTLHISPTAPAAAPEQRNCYNYVITYFLLLPRNVSSYLPSALASSSCLASNSNSHRGSTTSRRTDSTRTAYHL